MRGGTGCLQPVCEAQEAGGVLIFRSSMDGFLSILDPVCKQTRPPDGLLWGNKGQHDGAGNSSIVWVPTAQEDSDFVDTITNA